MVSPPIESEDLPAVAIQERLLAWFEQCRRPLSLRDLSDPYAIWIVETMSQQTQISRVAQMLPGFLERFPTVEALAAASIADVVKAWAGMGYNRRALHLHQAARRIVEQHGGRLPHEVSALEALPGIGPYTARAVAAVAFRRPVTAIDTNAGRVIGRVISGHGRAGDPGEPMTRGALQQIADSLAAAERPADWNHALMELGAQVCRPIPRCDRCPLTALCRLAQLGPVVQDRTDAARTRSRSAPAEPFETTRRWLRGRIIERLRSLDGAQWAHMTAAVGDHDAAAVAEAIRDLVREGLIEQRADAMIRLAR